MPKVGKTAPRAPGAAAATANSVAGAEQAGPDVSSTAELTSQGQ